MEPDELARFRPIDGVDVPEGDYVLAGRRHRPDTLNVTPDDALPRSPPKGRSPLTLDEGLALVAQFPEVLAHPQRVLAARLPLRRPPRDRDLGERGPPRLGWCWAGNPHTWLGSASCARRVSAAAVVDQPASVEP